MRKIFWLALFLLGGPILSWAKVSDIKRVQLHVEPAAVTPADEIEREVAKHFEKRLSEIQLTNDFADVKLRIEFHEIALPDTKSIAYALNMRLSGMGSDKIGTFEKVYWSKEDQGVVRSGKYADVWHDFLKKNLKEFAGAPDAEQFSAEVIGVSDGDTLNVMRQGDSEGLVTIRLYSVDCPEKTQAFGPEARQFTSDMALGKPVTVHVESVDRYGRVLGEVILPSGQSLNKELLRAGFAWWYDKYSKDNSLADLEADAESSKRGLWSQPDPTPPWEYRKENKPF